MRNEGSTIIKKYYGNQRNTIEFFRHSTAIQNDGEFLRARRKL